MYTQDYSDCLEYIDAYWDKIIHEPSSKRVKRRLAGIYYTDINLEDTHKSKKYHSIAVPYNYFTPNDRKFTFIFYWDSFFMFKALMGTKRQPLMRDMVGNFVHLFNTLGFIPNFNAPASLGRSQPPFLSSMIMDIYTSEFHIHSNRSRGEKMVPFAHRMVYKRWMTSMIEVAKKEYETVWVDKERLFNHSVEGYELARYGDRDVGYAHSSELESGWDMTSRFYNRCDQFLPIDLNIYLYKYETDFIQAAKILKNKTDETHWTNRAARRKKAINELLWDEKEGFFFDYGYSYKKISNFYSLAGFTPLWGGLATIDQAKRMVEKLPKFETPYGLMINAKESLANSIDLSKIQKRYLPAIEAIIKPKQWDYPNIWSPLEYLTVIGLLRYGFITEAKRIMENSVKAHSRLFRKHGTFFEKINGETGELPINHSHYINQPGFGWTNAAFFRYIHILDAIESSKEIYVQPKSSLPPYELAILH
ncbi:alpha,alpha-trehalase TreF [soil metagenome]